MSAHASDFKLSAMNEATTLISPGCTRFLHLWKVLSYIYNDRSLFVVKFCEKQAKILFAFLCIYGQMIKCHLWDVQMELAESISLLLNCEFKVDSEELASLGFLKEQGWLRLEESGITESRVFSSILNSLISCSTFDHFLQSGFGMSLKLLLPFY